MYRNIGIFNITLITFRIQVGTQALKWLQDNDCISKINPKSSACPYIFLHEGLINSDF